MAQPNVQYFDFVCFSLFYIPTSIFMEKILLQINNSRNEKKKRKGKKHKFKYYFLFHEVRLTRLDGSF